MAEPGAENVAGALDPSQASAGVREVATLDADAWMQCMRGINRGRATFTAQNTINTITGSQIDVCATLT